MKTLTSLITITAFLFVNALAAQNTVEKLSGTALQSAVSENLKKGKKEYDDIFGAYIITTNDIAISDVKKNEMLGKLKMLRSVFECDYDTNTNIITVKNRVQESKVEIEQIKNVISQYYLQINKYEQYLYRAKK